MNTPNFPLELKGNQLFIDNSTLSNITSCFRKAQYGTLARRREVKPRAALFFGGAIHKALETRDLEQQILCTPTIEDKMIDALVSYYEGAELNDDYRNLAYAIHVVKEYNRVWAADHAVPINITDSAPAVELPFAYPIGKVALDCQLWITDPDIDNGTPHLRHIDEVEIVFTGKIDRICQQNGQTYILDHKTTSMGGPTFFDEFYTSHQFRGYKWAAEQILGRPIKGVIINALVCRAPLKSGSVNLTFDRQTIDISDEQVLEDWQASFMDIIAMFLNSLTEGRFPMFTNSCITKYGRCEFFQVCQLAPRFRDTMLFSGLYEHNDWNPLEDSAKPTTKTPDNFPGLFQ